MRYLSVCSGIEAASAAWGVMGWTPVAFSEVKAFPSAVLAERHPGVPNLGDMTKFKDWPDATVDLLVGGTPCQSFSVAGLRKGLADPRGNLALTYLAIADRYRPEWVVWENVPGVLSSGGGRDFGAFLGGLGQLGYGFAYRVLDAQFVRVDGFGRAVPQRRRRVFVVGHSGDWRRAAAVLFEPESLSGNPAPRREAGQGVARPIAGGSDGGSGYRNDADTADNLLAFGGNNTSGPIDVATACQAHGGPHGRLSFDAETFIAHPVAKTLTRGAESAGKGGYAGRRQEDDDNLVATPYTLAIRGRGDGHQLEYRQDGTANAVLTPNGGRAGIGVGAIAFDTTQITSKTNRSNPQPGDPCHTLAKGADAPAIAFDAYNYAVGDVSPTMAGLDAGNRMPHTFSGWAVRRLTPTECERLQGFPDGYTAITYRGKPAADGPRYKALGNSMAVNVMRWLGRRIDMVRGIETRQEAA